MYLRPHGFQTEKVDGKVVGHLTADGELRSAVKRTCFAKKRRCSTTSPCAIGHPELVYLRSSVSLKGLSPGDYELTIILHDVLAKGATTSQAVKFKVIPPKDPRRETAADATRAGYALFAFCQLPRRGRRRLSAVASAARQKLVMWSVR